MLSSSAVLAFAKTSGDFPAILSSNDGFRRGRELCLTPLQLTRAIPFADWLQPGNEKGKRPDRRRFQPYLLLRKLRRGLPVVL